MPANRKPNEINIIRIFDAPAKAVWAAWTDLAQAAQWWGPRGFSITTHSKDLRPGGHWHYTMHGPDGTDYVNKTLYFEVEPEKKLVYDHGGSDERAPLFRVTVLFSDIGGDKTEMNMTMAMATPEAAEETRKVIKKAGGNTTWDRLAEYLIKTGTGREKFIVNRSFAAPIETLFEMWTDPKHFSQWLPPKGFTMHFIDADIRPGQSCFYAMTAENGMAMHGRVTYMAIEKPERLVYTQQFCDENGQTSRHPLSPNWPETMLTTVIFTAEELAQTRISVMWEPYGDVSAEELETFIAARAGMSQGWGGSFDKLEAYVEQSTL